MPNIKRHYTHNTSKEIYKTEKRTALIKDAKGKEVFRQDNVEVPVGWSELATNIVASKYFRGLPGSPERENSIPKLIARVVDTISRKGHELDYFNLSDKEIFSDELTDILIKQRAAFNSPVWFNVGAEDKPQCSACFINSVEDSMESILDLAKTEGMLFKYGSGTGSNLSTIRSSKEKLKGGGDASGPVSFMKGYDAFAGVIKSGGKCLAPTQHVYTAERGPVMVKELAEIGKDFLAISFDPPSNRFKIKTARAWASGKKTVVKITTDKGSFDLSADHPFKLSSGEVVRAGDLKVGMSLFACSIKDTHGYLSVGLKDGNKGKELLHRLVAKDIMSLNIKEKSVHHKDHNKTNNHPDNLELINQSDHATMHNNDLVEMGIHVFQTQRFDHKGVKNGMHSDSDFWKNEEKTDSYRETQKDILVKSGRSAQMQVLAAQQKMLNTGFEILNAGGDISSFDSYVKNRKQVIGRIPSITKLRKTIDSRFGSYENFVNEVAANNHRVVSITEIGEMETYDVEVDCPTADDKTPSSGHNFVIWDNDKNTGSGVVVLNTRRAAKMIILNAHHPDILEFVQCKAKEEKKAHALIDAGYDASFNGEAYSSVFFQNSNNSVRVTDEQMKSMIDDKEILLVNKDGKTIGTINGSRLLNEIAQAAWDCGDPGMQFDTEINKWHTCPNSGRINGSNPCSEYMFLDDSACNLASINLMKYYGYNGIFDIDGFKHTIDILILAQEIIVGFSSYPTEKIKQNSLDYRPLGLGYANLGALLMATGLAYDSNEGRAYAAAITSLMTAQAYLQSSKIAARKLPFEGYGLNKDAMLNVIKMHSSSNILVPVSEDIRSVSKAATNTWKNALTNGQKYGYRNSQVTVLAPTGTIGFMMDCDTTGIEPDIALVKYKSLVGGGTVKIVNQGISGALLKLGYSEGHVKQIVEYVDKNDTVEGCPVLAKHHLNVFDCAFKPANGTRSIDWQGHIKMMAVTQPYLSGAISKTINMPNTATVEDIKNAYIEAYKAGLKAVAIYRDGCKRSQPLNTSKEKVAVAKEVEFNHRRRLPNERRSLTHKFSVGGQEGYLTIGLYEDETPGEIFVTLSKEGSTLSGLMDMAVTAMSVALQHGAPLASFINKFKDMKFEPSGFTDNSEIRTASSIPDYIARYLELKFPGALKADGRKRRLIVKSEVQPTYDKIETLVESYNTGAPCSSCGNMTKRAGTCWVCTSCGTTTGCG